MLNKSFLNLNLSLKIETRPRSHSGAIENPHA